MGAADDVQGLFVSTVDARSSTIPGPLTYVTLPVPPAREVNLTPRQETDQLLSSITQVSDSQRTLREEIEQLLAAALQSDLNHFSAMSDARELHSHDMLALADVVDVDIAKLREAAAEIETLKAALVTRDVIGQAKGILMATLRCSADGAFSLLVRQSQHENRKVSEIAAEIAARASRGRNSNAERPPPPEQ